MSQKQTRPVGARMASFYQAVFHNKIFYFVYHVTKAASDGPPSDAPIESTLLTQWRLPAGTFLREEGRGAHFHSGFTLYLPKRLFSAGCWK